jgi:hypothetical protein
VQNVSPQSWVQYPWYEQVIPSHGSGGPVAPDGVHAETRMAAEEVRMRAATSDGVVERSGS